jgi:hypothetical protein
MVFENVRGSPQGLTQCGENVAGLVEAPANPRLTP